MNTDKQTEEEIKLRHPQQENSPNDDSSFNGNLSITALYTSAVWDWAQFSGAPYLISEDAKRVFSVTNFALSIMRLFRWSLPRLPEGLAQRHTLIDQLAKEKKPAFIIELASGLSMRGWRCLKEQQTESIKHYIEVDLPHVIEHKKQILDHNNQLPTRLSFFAKDLRELTLNDLEVLVADETELVFIAEGLVMYLSPEELRVLFHKVAQILVKRRGRLIFDWVPTVEQPPPGMFGRLLGRLMKLFTGGDSFQRDQRTRDDMKALLLSLGAVQVDTYDCHLIADQYSLPFADVNTQQLVFCAEFEGLIPTSEVL